MLKTVRNQKSEVRKQKSEISSVFRPLSSVFCSLSSVLCLLSSVLCSSPAQAQRTWDPDRLFSPSVAKKFYEVAYELANSKEISPTQAEQAIVFLTATINLDSRAKHAVPDMIKLVSRPRLLPPHQNGAASFGQQRDYTQFLHNLLANYIDQSADLEVAKQAVSYLIERLNSREMREGLLGWLLQNLGAKNLALDSELATLLALLNAERADLENATSLLTQAYNRNKYNKLAFAKLVEIAPELIKPPFYLEYLRLALGENPLDMEAALGFAQYAEKLQLYNTAADAYKYCVDLFSFLYPSQPLPQWLYIPWAITNYNTQRNQRRCLQIAEQVRQTGRFDLLLEVIAGKAAAKTGHIEQANQILQAAEDKINNQSSIINNQYIAWFYCFAYPDAEKALDWANRAYSNDPNSTTTAVILAYSLVMNHQTDWAKTLIHTVRSQQPTSNDADPATLSRGGAGQTMHRSGAGQIASLAMAQIQIAQGQHTSAIETLKDAIASDPGSLEAEHAKEILARHGADYIPPTDPDITLTMVRNSLAEEGIKAVVPTFVSPQNLISVQLNTRGSKFSYGSDFGASVAIINNSSEPLVVSDNALFKGNIRIDASVSGDLNKKIPNLVSVKIRPPSPTEPGRTILIPVRLLTGELRRLLLTHPQASVDIEFTAFIDPVTTDQQPANALPGLEPARVLVKRPATEITTKFLQNRLNSLSKGRQGQKIKTAQLFVGLLMEQHTMANQPPLYKFSYADWMPDVLKSALLHSLADDDWIVKVHTMDAILSLPLDYELTNAAAENLDDTHWPARLMAIYLLAKSQDKNFTKVLDWTAKYDSNGFVRDMAIALGAAVPKPQEPISPPDLEKSEKQPPTSER